MKIDQEYNALFLSEIELGIVAEAQGTAKNNLSVIPPVQPSDAQKHKAQTEFNQLGQESCNIFSLALKALSSPAQVVQLHYSIAEDSVTRSTLAWSVKDTEEVAVLSQGPEGFSLNLRSAQEIKQLLLRVLAVDDTLINGNFAIGLSVTAALTLLAVMDYFRYDRYRSVLTHASPSESFAQEEILERIKDAQTEDFRWPLLFVEKVLPLDISGTLASEDISKALDELTEAGILIKIDQDKDEAGGVLYSLAEGAEIVNEGLLHNVSKVAIAISGQGEDNQIGHETLFFVRDPRFLWLFDFAGDTGALASLDTESFNELIERVFTPLELKAGPQPPQAQAPGVAVETKMETPVSTAPKFCQDCGKPVTNAQAKFCTNCGKPFRK